MEADLEIVKLPGVKEIPEEAAQEPEQGEGPIAVPGAEAVPTRTAQGLVEGAVGALPSSAALSGADPCMDRAQDDPRPQVLVCCLERCLGAWISQVSCPKQAHAWVRAASIMLCLPYVLMMGGCRTFICLAAGAHSTTLHSTIPGPDASCRQSILTTLSLKHACHQLQKRLQSIQAHLWVQDQAPGQPEAPPAPGASHLMAWQAQLQTLRSSRAVALRRPLPMLPPPSLSLGSQMTLPWAQVSLSAGCLQTPPHLQCWSPAECSTGLHASRCQAGLSMYQPSVPAHNISMHACAMPVGLAPWCSGTGVYYQGLDLCMAAWLIDWLSSCFVVSNGNLQAKPHSQ